MKIPSRPSGVFLRRNLTLEILDDGKGLAIQLSPDQARTLAAELLVLADVRDRHSIGEVAVANPTTPARVLEH